MSNQESEGRGHSKYTLGVSILPLFLRTIFRLDFGNVLLNSVMLNSVIMFVFHLCSFKQCDNVRFSFVFF